ncbi:MAG: hypothetical protein JSS46_11685 [Proteobacteria bacterium]|nr:hypothetical protein [Pseudomonadota bacterium]
MKSAQARPLPELRQRLHQNFHHGFAGAPTT